MAPEPEGPAALVTGCEPRLSGLGPPTELVRASSAVARTGEEVSFCNRLSRRGKVCREGVLLEDHSPWSVLGVVKLEGPAS